jgi:transcription antitermination factor NusG
LSYWTVAKTEPNRENFATEMLGQRGFETYSPRIVERITRRRRQVTVERSLFATYIFVVIVDRWYDARWCPGIAKVLLGANGTPEKVPPAVITSLKSRERNGLIQLPPKPSFRPGEPVKVVRGLFIGRLGLYEGQRGSERVAVLLASLGHIELAAGDVAAV